MHGHPILDELDVALSGLVRAESVELAGSWRPVTRRTYEHSKQLGSGDGPFVEVLDWRWRGQLSGSTPIAAVAFLVMADQCLWSKSVPPLQRLEVNVSFHAYADRRDDRATFAAGVSGALLPGIPIAWNHDPATACELSHSSLVSGRVAPVAAVPEASFAVLVLPAEAVTTARHRLWRVRDAIAAALPPRSRELLTRRRSGSLR